jgi:hypothetical protein
MNDVVMMKFGWIYPNNERRMYNYGDCNYHCWVSYIYMCVAPPIRTFHSDFLLKYVCELLSTAAVHLVKHFITINRFSGQ